MASQNISPSCKYLIGVAAVATLSLLSSPASAQALYRSVGPDGRITFSDRAPVAATGKASVERRLEASSVPAATLPYELREVASRYPVTLYAAADCAPCASARALLAGRGVPFTERTVTGNEDIAALKALSGDGSLPFAMLGSQQLRGFSEQEWQRNLDAAGYPKTSLLPANWTAAVATPLAPRVQAVQVAPEASATSRTNATQSRAAAGDGSGRSNNAGNPAGIRF